MIVRSSKNTVHPQGLELKDKLMKNVERRGFSAHHDLLRTVPIRAKI